LLPELVGAADVTELVAKLFVARSKDIVFNECRDWTIMTQYASIAIVKGM
jgi:hypothetical protein